MPTADLRDMPFAARHYFHFFNYTGEAKLLGKKTWIFPVTLEYVD
jgi:hypothetical protein